MFGNILAITIIISFLFILFYISLLPLRWFYKDIGILGYGEYDRRERTGDFVRSRIRRFFALRKCKKYLSVYEKTYMLKNKLVVIIYNTEKQTMTIYDRKVRKKCSSVEWIKQDEAKFDYIDNSFKRIFDYICSSFNEDIKYSDILAFLNVYFTVNTENSKKVKAKEIPKTNKMYEVEEYIFLRDSKKKTFYNGQKIDINTAEETELAKLPGINIITAKKIIGYRELHNGFKSKEEFYKKLKIKPHFQAQLEELIITGSILIKTKIYENKERIIDI